LASSALRFNTLTWASADHALLDRFEAVHGFDQRRFTRTGWAAHHDHVTARDRDRAGVEYLEGAVPFADVVEFYHVVTITGHGAAGPYKLDSTCHA
jgi:hypothetical protein